MNEYFCPKCNKVSKIDVDVNLITRNQISVKIIIMSFVCCKSIIKTEIK